ERALGLGFGGPPLGRAAGEGVLVDDADAAADGEVGDAILFLQLGDEGGNLGDGLDEGGEGGELRADVHLHALDGDVGILGGGGIGGGGVFEGDAELVLGLAGGDLGVGLGIDVGVDADGDGGLDAEFAGHVVD